ncbi:MAG: AbiV family abortive infection protein [Cryobacterium sp.]|nr:AbiV family abortive infection protein [Cryobacterium sp.]
MLTPTAARAFWLALLENAARIIIDADALFPSPRAQSLVVLAQEEVGKAVWVYKSFWNAWNNGDETPREVPELRKQGLHHLAKLIEATDFLTALVEVPGSSEPVESELVKTHAPDVLDAYLKGLAQEDNEAKKRGFYVDLRADGSFTVPHEIDRPLLRFQIWQTADMVQWFLVEDHLRASVTGRTVSPTEEVEALLGAVLAHGPDDEVGGAL